MLNSIVNIKSPKYHILDVDLYSRKVQYFGLRIVIGVHYNIFKIHSLKKSVEVYPQKVTRVRQSVFMSIAMFVPMSNTYFECYYRLQKYIVNTEYYICVDVSNTPSKFIASMALET